jgi:hypothetical protein
MASVFLSHSSADKPFVYRLAQDLKSMGHQIWLDEWELRVGQHFISKMDEGTRRADYVILVLTPESVSSGWVEREWNAAYRSEIDQDRLVVLPVLVRPCTIPTELQTKKYADFTKDYATGLGQLIKVLRTVYVRSVDPLLANRSLITIRRGPGAESVKNHRIASIFLGQENWSFAAIVESQGAREESVEATRLAGECVQEVFSRLSQRREPLSQDTMLKIFIVVNSAIRHFNVSKKLPPMEMVCTKMAASLQIRDDVLLATTGDTGAIAGQSLNDDENQILVAYNNLMMPSVEEWETEGPRRYLRGAPLGLCPDSLLECMTFDAKSSRLALKDDYVVLTSFIPPQEDRLVRRILGRESGSEVGTLLCEEHEPPSDECMALALIRTESAERAPTSDPAATKKRRWQFWR